MVDVISDTVEFSPVNNVLAKLTYSLSSNVYGVAKHTAQKQYDEAPPPTPMT